MAPVAGGSTVDGDRRRLRYLLLRLRGRLHGRLCLSLQAQTISSMTCLIEAAVSSLSIDCGATVSLCRQRVRPWS